LPAARPFMIIDFHAHMGKGIDGTDDLLQSGLTAEMILGPAREAGIDRTVVFPVTYRAADYGSANREVAEAVRTHPDELIGFARTVVGPIGLRDVREAAETLGLKGLKLHHGLDSFDLAGPDVIDVVRLAGELGLPVLFHSIGAVRELGDIARACPATNIVFGHMGGLWDWRAARACIGLAEELPNVWLETSSLLVSFVLAEAGRRVPGRVLFGTDAPALHPKVELTKILVADIDESARRRILGENAARLIALSL
jgi:predicted TIM-barrel fold metal-dependent hydrolase